MADDNLSLLFKLRADNAQAKATIADTKAALNSLRSAFGSDLSQMQSVSAKAFGAIQGNLQNFVSRIPGGNLFVSVTSGLQGITAQADKVTPALKTFNKSVDDLSKTTGKSSTELIKFLGEFVKLPNATDRGIAGYIAFGSKFDELEPKLAAAGKQLVTVASETEAAGAGLAAMAGPIGVGIIAIGAMAAGSALLAKGIFNLAQQAAGFRGALFDTSQQLGISVETLSALEIVAQTTGGNIASITAALGVFQQHLEDAQDPTTKQAALLRELGVETDNTEDALRQTLTALAAMPEGFQQTSRAADLFGRSSKSILAILKEMDGNLDGAIAKFREMGIVISTEDAKAADELNDQLALLNFQFRAMVGQDAIPAVLSAMQALSDSLKNNKEGVKGLGIAVGGLALAFGTQFVISLGLVNDFFKSAVVSGRELRVMLEAAADALDRIRGIAPRDRALARTVTGGVTGVTPDEAEAKRRKRLQSEIQELQELTGAQKAATADAKAIAETGLKDSERSFERGRITRQQNLQNHLLVLEQIRQADLASVEQQRTLKLKQFEVAQEGTPERTSAINALADLDAARRGIESKFIEDTKQVRHKAQLEEQKAAQEHEQAKLKLFLEGSENAIRAIEDEVARGNKTREQGALEADAIETEQINRRKQRLEEERKLVADPSALQAINDQIAALEVERTEVVRRQNERRLAIARDAGENEIAIIVATAEAVVKRGEALDDERIASLKFLAAARVKTEEETAAAITKILLDANQRQQDLVKVKQTAAEVIADPLERARVEAELNNELKRLQDERSAIINQGGREQEEGRQKDLDNERKYAAELLSIRRRIVDIQRQTAQAIIDLMIIHHARRRDIIRAQVDLDIQDETARHEQQQKAIEAQRRENAESNKTQDEKNQKTEELNRLEEAEAERHRLEMQRIKDQGKRDEKKADPTGKLEIDSEDLRDFASTIEDSVVPLNEILTNSFLQVADAIGSVIEQWILYGETGPAVMRKILAAALATIAKEAAINAIKMLAVGFALLATGQPGAGAAFTSAALWAAIAGGAAGAGRAIAGDTFKQKDQDKGGGLGGSTAEALQTIITGRNQRQDRTITIHLTSDLGELRKVITANVVQDYNDGGEIREVITNDGR